MSRKTGKNRLKRARKQAPSFMSPQEFRAIREVLGISQTQMGERLGLGFQAVLNKEKGHVPIKKLEAETMRRLRS